MVKKKIKFGDLVEYLEKKCDFKEKIKGKPESVTWKCDGDLGFTKEFCKKNKVNFKALSKTLEDTGGYCDCEVLFNSIEKINEMEIIK